MQVTKKRLEAEEKIVNALDKANTILSKANEHAEHVGFSFESAARTVTGKLEKSFEFMEDIPFLSDVIGLDSIKEKLEKNVRDSLISSMAAGQGAGVSMFKAMTVGAGSLMTAMLPFLPLIIAAAALYKAFEFDKELTQFSKDLDVSKHDAMGLSIQADEIAGHFEAAGINGVEVGKAMITIKEEMGATAALANDELVGAVSLLQTKVGLTGQEAMALNHTATLLGTNLNDLAASSYDMADGLIGGKAMLKEMSKLPKALIAGFKGTTKELQKAIVKGKLFGLTIEEAAEAGESLLDVESSLEKEMTFNVLSGKNMNLNKARQLALEGKQSQLQDELLERAGSLSEFQEMGPLQQKAMADAMGMTKEKLTEILTRAQELADVGLSQAAVDAQMNKSLEDQQSAINGMSDVKKKAYLQDLLNKKKQEEATEKFTTSMSKLTEAFQKTMMPVVELLGDALGFIGNIVDYLTMGVEKINQFFHWISGSTESLKEGEGVMSSILGWAVKIGAAILLWQLGIKPAFKAIAGGAKSMISGAKSMIPGMGGGKTAEATPDAQSFKAAKGSNKGLEDMSKGLQSMGQSGVEQGVANLKAAGPGLMAANMSKKFLKFIGQTKLKELETNFKNLSEGLKKMADTKSGSASLLIYGVAALIANLGNGFTKFMGQTKLKDLEKNFTALSEGLKKMSGTAGGSLSLGLFGIAAIPALISIPFLLFLGKTKLKELEKNFTSLSTGLLTMSGTIMGSAGLGVFAAAGALAILSIPFLLFIGKVELATLGSNFTALSTGLIAMSGTFVGSAALLLFAVAGALAIPSLIFLGGIALIGELAAVGLTALGTGLLALGTAAATGLPFIAVALIAAIGVAMIPFAYALNLATPAIEAFGNVMVKVFEGLALIIGAVADGISKIIRTVAESIKSLATLNGPNMIAVAAGIVALGAAIAGFGAGSLLGGIAKGIGDFFGGNPADNFKKFESINGAKLLQTASAILALSAAIKQFSSLINADQLDSVSNAIDKLIDSLSNFEAAADSIKQVGISISTFVSLINVDQLNSVSTAIDKLAISLSNFGSLINAAQLDSVSNAIDKLAKSLSNFGASAAAGGLMGAIGKFFDEDPVEKFNRFAKIDSNKLIEVASAIDKLGAAFKNFSESVSNIGDTSGITNTIDKVLELHDAITKSPLEKVMEEVVSGVGDVFSTAGKWVASVIPGLESIDSKKSKETASAAPNPNSEVVAVLNKILAATSSPVKINIGSKVIEEIGRITSLTKTYTGKIDQSYGAKG